MYVFTKKYQCIYISCLVPVKQALLSLRPDGVVYKMTEIFICINLFIYDRIIWNLLSFRQFKH